MPTLPTSTSTFPPPPPLVFFPLPRKENRRKETRRQFPPSSSMPSPYTITNSLPNTTTNWSQKVGNYITRKGNSSSSSKNLDLTEESLEEFNRRNEMLFDKKISSNNNNKTTGYSPYSRGLTDSSLALHRQRLSSATSPERESNASTSISSGSKSSFIVKIQEWGSNFVSGSKEAKRARPAGTRWSQHTRTLSSSSTSSSLSTKTALTTLAKELGLEAQIVTVGLKGKKPLRERDSENPPLPVSPLLLPPVPLPPPQPPPLASPPSPPLQTPQPPPLSPPPPQAQASFSESTYVWADRYRPEALKDFICNRDKALELKALAKKEDCGHFIFEGPPGVGKKTMIWALLRESYGEDKVQTKEELKKFVLKGEVVSSIKVSVKISPQHVEVNLSEVKGYEKHVIVELMQETINRLAKKALQCNKDNCRVIILYEADKLSADALLYIKWQLGRHKGCSKVFFCCSDASKLQPIMSLCTVVKLLPPSNEEIVKVLEFIAKQEGIELPHQLADKIAINAKNNLRQAIRSLEATWQANSALTEDQEIMIGWEGDIANIAKNIVEEQSPKQLYVIRGKLQNLIEHNVCPSFIIDALVRELKKCSADEFQEQIDSLYDEYKKTARKRDEDSLKRHKDPVKKNLHHFMRIEEFTAKFMSCYKMWIMNKKST
ncbi:replication factor C subunit 3-like [Camellia sinensis]|uniref:replication factor C subunit 3-like n=1 Tax=Camellia sinensis TaxID=4442 RepID=UPI0010360D64|nr:replication factor C subunit 3-like [Camellia sinensis]